VGLVSTRSVTKEVGLAMNRNETVQICTSWESWELRKIQGLRVGSGGMNAGRNSQTGRFTRDLA
jgi:hypothetical protein